MPITCKTEWGKVHSLFHKILLILPQTKASSPGHVNFLILDGDEHGEHDNHVCRHPISQPQHAFGRKTKDKNARIISLVFSLAPETFLNKGAA